MSRFDLSKHAINQIELDLELKNSNYVILFLGLRALTGSGTCPFD